MITRRRWLALTSVSALIPAGGNPAWAQGYPNRFVRLVVPFAAGGATDAAARLLAARLSEIWGQQVVIENRGGAGGNLAAQSVATAEADGYTLYFPSLSHATNKFMYRALAYDPVADFAPVSLVCSFPNIMVVPNSSPARSVTEFITHAKANRLSYASAGSGTSLHLAGELFRRSAGVDLAHIPYRGGGPAVGDVLAGRVDVMFGNAGSMLPLIQNGQVRGLAVTSEQRLPAAPDLPSIAETLPGFDVSAWYAIFAPRKTPADVIATVHRDAVAALAHPAVKDTLERIGAVPIGSTPQQLADFLEAEMKRWEPVIRDSGIKMD
jgi:tripartite-type tricarboxylate transporter receptor subunit TctC